MANDLVKIGAAKVLGSSDGVSRRDFLKMTGVGSAAAALSACADPLEQRVFPNLKGEADRIPGVAVWYASTCSECTAGCGIQVRTRDGRAVKVEGNPDNPINRGGLCALGQSSLQSLYDPDRVREPLKKGPNGFAPISWDAAYDMIAEAMKKPGKKAMVTGEVSGALAELAADFSKACSVEHVVWDPMQPAELAKSSEALYGTYGVPEYSFDKAEVILNFGADFLETWVSPCGYARDWAKSRKTDHPAKFIHVEPRLSLTGASADMWLSAAPGTEAVMALGILRYVIERGRGGNLSEDVLSKLKSASKQYDLDKVASITGVARDKLLAAAEALASAKTSLVLAGGSAASTSEAQQLYAAVSCLNHALENVGTTVDLSRMRKPQSSLVKMSKLSEVMAKVDLSVLFVYGSNPSYSLPGALNFKNSIKGVPLVVSFSSHIDETAEAAHLILPSNTGLEAWGDSRFSPGVYGLMQPSMMPVFNTRDFGDSLIKIGSTAGSLSAGADNFKEYLNASWKKLHQSLGIGGDFEKFWLESLERGGYYAEDSGGERAKVKFTAAAFDFKFSEPKFDGSGAGDKGLVVYPFPSVKTFDGRSANRPWLQEVPDPITQVVWDAWAEIHPETAKARDIIQGDMVTVRNANGEVNVPAFVTEFVHPGIVAVPLGQGHTSYGRYAKQVVDANAFTLVSTANSSGADGASLVSSRAMVSRGRGKSDVVIRQGSNSQQGRGLARLKVVDSSASGEHADHGAHGHGHGGHGELKQMYEQRVHPLYHWGLNVDLAACTGCSACVVACYAENNIPVVGKKIASQNREMSWLRIERYYDLEHSEELHVSFLPMMCQQCGNAPCEPVCPVYATYHNEEGLNAMAYNRCVGTRYCSNNCSYKVRRFNWFEYKWPEVADLQLNPDVTPRVVGVMEKCTFCVQRIVEAKDRAKDLGRMVRDGDVKPACVQSCPTQALTFGNLNDPASQVAKASRQDRAYKVLDEHLNTQPSVSYLEDVRVKI